MPYAFIFFVYDSISNAQRSSTFPPLYYTHMIRRHNVYLYLCIYTQTYYLIRNNIRPSIKRWKKKYERSVMCVLFRGKFSRVVRMIHFTNDLWRYSSNPWTRVGNFSIFSYIFHSGVCLCVCRIDVVIKDVYTITFHSVIDLYSDRVVPFLTTLSAKRFTAARVRIREVLP